MIKTNTQEERMWEKVTADMMSEEETDNDEFVRRKPSWSSNLLNSHIKKLEKRVEKGNRKSLARKRKYGTSLDKKPPPNVSAWMMNKSTESEPEVEFDSLISASDDNNSADEESNGDGIPAHSQMLSMTTND